MTVKIIIYALSLLLTSFSISGINFTNLFKKDHVIEARIFVMIVIIGLSYLLSSFIISFLNI